MYKGEAIMKSKLLLAAGLLVSVLGSYACEREADIASRNLSYAADDFNIMRKVAFYNGVTGESMLVITGLCSIGNDDRAGRLSITCKTGTKSYKKHFLGLSDNVTFIAEQIDEAKVNSYQYSVQFNPRAVLPDISIRK